jgi:hypothetical protein
MIDPFVLLTPILLLAVIALLRFVGCKAFGTADPGGNPVPTTSTIDPTSKTEGGDKFTLTVNGTNFVKGSSPSVVRWNGPFPGPTDRQTIFVTDKQLTADITAADIANAGIADVTVFNPAPDGGTSTPALKFTIVAIPPVSVTFDDLGALPPGLTEKPLSGNYKNLNFGANWYWKGSGAGNSIFLGPPSNTNPATGSLSFASPRVLLRARILAELDGAKITLKDGVNPDASKTVNIADGLTYFDTGWKLPSMSIGVSSSVGWDISIDTIVYKGPPL